MLLGVNIGPNLTYAGSLATLLWRRIVHAHEEQTDLRSSPDSLSRGPCSRA